METNTTQILSSAVLLALSFSLQACAPAGPVASQNNSNSVVESTELFSTAQAIPALSPEETEQSAMALRERFVTLNASALQTLAQAQPYSKIQLNLFEEAPLSILIEEVETPAAGNTVLTGRIDGDAESSVTLVLNQGVLAGNISRGEEEFEIRSVGEGVHAVRSVSPEAQAPCETQTTHDEAHDEGDAEMESGFEMQSAAPLATPIVDVLVAYTPNAKSQQGGKAGIEALIQMGVADANRAYADSGVNLKVRLAGILELKTNETGNYFRDLESLKGTRDGRWDEVHRERDRLGADQVSLVGTYASNRATAGIGYFNSRDASAFTVTQTSAFRQYTFVHELGHNMGLDHSDGFVNSQGRFRTIMAYGSYPRIRRFSNPSIVYNGHRTGDGRHNEAGILNRNAAKLANLRTPLF